MDFFLIYNNINQISMKIQLAIMLAFSFVTSCAQKQTGAGEMAGTNGIVNHLQNNVKLKVATFAGGCFWCTETIFDHIIGVHEVISGYSGGKEENPTYEMVGSGRSSHAEAFQVYYDPVIISYKDLVRVFFASIDPTMINGQGPDRGTQYRTIAFYNNEVEKQIILDKIREIGRDYDDPIATQVLPFEKFYEAEDYHQDFVRRNPYQGYVRHESIPRRQRTLAKVQELVKKDVK